MLTTIYEKITIVDGSGYPRYVTDVAIAEDRLAVIGSCSEREAASRVNASGRTIAPAFFDACSLDDEASSFHNPELRTAKSAQGIIEQLRRGDLVNTRDVAGDPYRVTRAACENGALGVWIDARGERCERMLRALEGARDGGAPFAAIVGAEIELAVQLAERVGVRVHLPFITEQCSATPDGIARALAQIDRARARSVDVTCDLYPYRAAWRPLNAYLPDGVQPRDLRDPALAAVTATLVSARHGDRLGRDVFLADVSDERYHALCGRSFDAIGDVMRLSPARALISIAAHDGTARSFDFCIREDDVAAALSADFCSVSTAAPTLELDDARFGYPHPRAYGSFPRIIARFVNERRTLTLEDAVRRMTQRTLAADTTADFVIFDSTLRDTATYDHPTSLPTGMHLVVHEGAAIWGDWTAC